MGVIRASLALPVVNSRQVPAGFPQEVHRLPGRRSRSPTLGKPRGWHPGRIWPSLLERTALPRSDQLRFRRPVPFRGPALPSRGGRRGGRRLGRGSSGGSGGGSPGLRGPLRTPLRCPGSAGASLRGGSIPGPTSPSGGIRWRRGLRRLTRAASRQTPAGSARLPDCLDRGRLCG